MPKKDRGDNFGGYYLVPDPSQSNQLFGAEWLHSFPCGTCMVAGVEYGVTFFKFYKDELPDSFGRNAESFDVDVSSGDLLGDEPPFQHLLAGYISAEVIATLHPVTQYLIGQDLAEGLSCEQIIDKRAAVLVPEFLGFAYDQIPTQYIQPRTVTDEEGNETVVDNIRRCSLEE